MVSLEIPAKDIWLTEILGLEETAFVQEFKMNIGVWKSGYSMRERWIDGRTGRTKVVSFQRDWESDLISSRQ